MNAENQRELFQYDGLVGALVAVIKKDSGPARDSALNAVVNMSMNTENVRVRVRVRVSRVRVKVRVRVRVRVRC